MVIGTIERTTKFVRNKFSALFSNFSTNCSKKTKSIYIVPRTYNMLHESPSLPPLSHSFSLSFIGDFNYISFGLNLFTGVNYFLKRFFCISVSLSFFLGNEKTINHCTNEVRVWATLTSIFLMPFFSILFLSFFIVKCNID